ncbi:MAG TPA: ATP-binding protein [Thermoanaerobaculia bacterium]|jgi:heavy metal sensor kinase|nr:ATP-binding protein [Thermoanaerobaculia bacterium]
MIVDSIRGRLTAWYTLVLAIVLIAAGMMSYAVMRRQMGRTTDASLRTSAHQLASALAEEAAENHGALQLSSASEVLANFRDNDRPMIILGANGSDFAASVTPITAAVDRAALRQRVARHSFGLSSLHGPHELRLILSPLRLGGSEYFLAIAQSLDEQKELLADLRHAMVVTIPLALLIAAAGGYLLARKSLAPVAAMSAKARAISATSLGERVAVANPADELGQLAITLNALLERLEQSFDSQRRFMADASHELRTPVAILQGELDVTLSRDDRDAHEYRDSLEIMRKSVQRLTRIVRDLFLLARGDAGQYPMRNERFYLDEVVSQTVQGFRTLAAERGVVIAEEHEPDLVMRGDEDLVQRLIGNLIENAIKHEPSGGQVLVRSSSADGGLRIEVHDSGSGIAPELRERIFERFFGEDGGGAGLGLPIARWIAEVHGGRVWLDSSGSSGSVFVATLPGT